MEQRLPQLINFCCEAESKPIAFADETPWPAARPPRYTQMRWIKRR